MKSSEAPRGLVQSILFILGAILVVVPIVIFPGIFFTFITSKTFTFIALTDLAFALYLYLAICYPAYRPKKNILLLSLGAFVLISIISAIRSVSPVFSFWSGAERSDGVLLLIHVFLFFVVFGSVVRSTKALRTLLTTSVIGAFIVAVSAYFGSSGTNTYTQIYGLQTADITGNDSFTAVYLLFNLFFSAYLLSTASQRKHKIMLGLVVFFLFFSPVFINFGILKGSVSLSALFHNPVLIIGTARGAMIGLVIGAIGTGILFYAGHAQKAIRVIARVLLGIYIIGVITSISLLFMPNNRIHNWFEQETSSHRYIYWHQALEGFKDHPVLGWGPSTFEWVSTKYFNPAVLIKTQTADKEAWNDKPHNAFLEVLVTRGALGFAAYLAVFITFFILLWRAPVTRFTKALFSGVLIAYLLQNLILFDMLLSYLMLMVLFATTLIFTELGTTTSPVPATISKGAKQGYAALSTALALFSILYFAIQPLREVRQRFVVAHSAPDVRAANDERVRDISPLGDGVDEAYEADVLYLTYTFNIQQVATAKDPTPFLADIDAMIKNLEDAFQGKEMSYRGALTISHFANVRYVILHKNDPSTIELIKKYGKLAIDLSPTNPEGYWAYAQGFIYDNDYKTALDILEQGMELNPQVASSHIVILNLARVMGDKKLYTQALARAERDVPDFALQYGTPSPQ